MAIPYKITTNALETAQYFAMMGREVPARVGAVVARGSVDLLNRVKGYAPVETGKYRASLRVVEAGSPTRWTYFATISSDEEYGEMLEEGGMGTDWAGRPVMKPPRPHYAPAIMEFEPLFYSQLEKVVS